MAIPACGDGWHPLATVALPLNPRQHGDSTDSAFQPAQTLCDGRRTPGKSPGWPDRTDRTDKTSSHRGFCQFCQFCQAYSRAVGVRRSPAHTWCEPVTGMPPPLCGCPRRPARLASVGGGASPPWQRVLCGSQGRGPTKAKALHGFCMNGRNWRLSAGHGRTPPDYRWEDRWATFPQVRGYFGPVERRVWDSNPR